jgi:ABC-2 type transport system permease protein
MLKLPRNILLIARREYLEKIRGRAFRLSTVLVPVLMILMLGGSFFTTRSLGVGRHIVIAAPSPALARAVRNQLLVEKNARLIVDVEAPAAEQDRTTLSQQVRSNAIDGYLWIQMPGDDSPSATYVSGSAGDSITAARLESALNDALLRQRLAESGVAGARIDALLQNVPVQTLRLTSAGKTGRSSDRVTLGKILLEIFLLTMPILLYGMDMARSIIEEKGSRIFEVMLSVVRPGDLLTGKLIGIGGVGLTQIAIWVGAAVLLSGSALAATLMHSDLSVSFSWVEGVLFPVYFVLGFLLYSSLFSGLAATCETVQEFQMYAPLAVLPTWFSFGIIPLVLNNPNSPWAVGASLFPFTSPFIMVPRIGLQTPPLWQIAVSIALLILCIWAVLWFSSRLYRVGILMYGKRATLPELMRWLRYS